MTYVMTDLHGEYEKYKKMLEKIRFSHSDTLYINGDVCDRGDEPARIYLDIMARDNVFMIKGNHEMMAEEALERLFREHRGMGIDIFGLYSDPELWSWFANGGDRTVISMFDETEENRHRILNFIKSLPYHRTVEVNGRRFVMVHGGTGDAPLGTLPDQIPPFDLVWTRPDFDACYFGEENTFLIVGHTPTFIIQRSNRAASIYHGKGDVIAIDCGAVYSEYGGRLSCLCLDNLEEFYV